MCRVVIHSTVLSQDIRFIGGLSVYITFTTSGLIVSNFALCGMTFLTGFCSEDFTLVMFSMRYINMFEFFLLLLSRCLRVYSSLFLFYFVICGDINFVSSYSLVETSYNRIFGIIDLLIITIFARGLLCS
jgi:NADH:ubiquinone oxidoreductase subunit 5 (subunit L)/multisubunit Na+/H+ antiporter MnhA subunit